ncbi:MAG: extracellular solute-binding protein [Treponema sp.]|nr:extracellular solute-binding protein [Treponema sp.]
MKSNLLFGLAIGLLLVSCAQKESRLLLETNNAEFASCAELFNASQDEVKVIVHYKDELIKNLGADKDSPMPDLLAGSYLQSGIEKKYFANISSLIKEKGPLDKDAFYPSLLQSGRLNEKQFLLPVSFNLPALVFYSANSESLQNAAMLSFDDIKDFSKKFNSQNKEGVYTSMGFGPLWSMDFLYLVFKDNGVFFNPNADSIVYTENAFNKSVEYVRDWIEEINGGAKNEQDFAFKYLYMPFYNQAQSGRCLFSYASSRQILSLSKDQIQSLDFRWICNNNKIQIEDDYVSIGILAKSKNKAAAKKFIVWLMGEYSQKQILDRKAQMNLSTDAFGIAGGFSSLQNVTERLFPLYYRFLLSNTPVADRLSAPQNFPSDWAKIKEIAVEPFILDSCSRDDEKIKSLNERYADFLASQEK